MNLRPLEPTDLPAVRAWLSDPETRAGTAHARPEHGTAMILKAIEDGDRLLGTVEFFNITPDAKQAELGICLAPEARHQGIGGRAVLQMIQDGLAAGIERIVARIAPGSPHRAGLQRLGFVRVVGPDTCETWLLTRDAFRTKWGDRHGVSRSVHPGAH